MLGILSPWQYGEVAGDVATITEAIDSARSFSRPDRTHLVKWQESVVVLDGHLRAVIDVRRRSLLQQKLMLYDRNGEPMPKLMQELFNGLVLRKLIGHIQDSQLFGHSLVEGRLDPMTGKLVAAELIPRVCVRPESAEILPQGNAHGAAVCYDETRTVPLSWEHTRAEKLYKPSGEWFLLEAGEPRELGVLAACAVTCEIRKAGLEDGAERAEAFGMPVVGLETSEEDKSKRQQLLDHVKNMSSRGVALMPPNVKLHIIESANQTGHEIYKWIVDYGDTVHSELILGNTMTTKDGSSRAQAQVHERVSQRTLDSDKMLVVDTLTDRLLPQVARYNRKVEGAYFGYQKQEDLTMKEQMEILEKAAAMGYTVDEAQLQAITGMKLTKGNGGE